MHKEEQTEKKKESMQYDTKSILYLLKATFYRCVKNNDIYSFLHKMLRVKLNY